jgi:scyllo-inositol 2-dehydrogenase (NADP+)
MRKSITIITVSALVFLTLGELYMAQGEEALMTKKKPVRVAVVGLTHTHVHWILGRDKDKGDIEIVGIYEPNEELAERYLKRHGFDRSLHYTDLEKMLDEVRPEAVTLFGSIREHTEQTRLAAARGIHVMVEKPLAVSLAEAGVMRDAAREAGVHLLTNYETTWYASNTAAVRMAEGGELGAVRRVVVNSGHPGPIEIGCNQEFLKWLTDPKESGGGALMDFGCYGVNLMTWLMDNRRPDSVYAVTMQTKPKLYPDVEDDATIILDYGDAVCVVQASWSWTNSRKDMTVYGTDASVETVGGDGLIVTRSEKEPVRRKAAALEAAQSDPFSHLAAVVRGEEEPNALSSIENNMIVMEILDAAKRSAGSGERVVLGD